MGRYLDLIEDSTTASCQNGTSTSDPAGQFTPDLDGYIRIAGWSRICRSCGLLEWLPIRHNPEHPGTACPSCGDESHVQQKTIALPPTEEATP